MSRFSRPPFEHMARDVQRLKRLNPSLLHRFPVGWCAQWKELALWLRKDGRQVSFDDVASRVEARGAVDVQYLRCEVASQQSRDTNLKESTGQVPIDASLCSLRPPRRGEEVLRIDSDHIQASGFDCLRQHNQVASARHVAPFVCPGRWPLQASFPFCILLQASNAQSHTSQSRTFANYLSPDPSEWWMSSVHVTSKLRRVWSRRLPRLSKLYAPGHASRNKPRWCVCSSSFARHFSVTLKMPPVGLHGHCHTLRRKVSLASVPSVKISGKDCGSTLLRPQTSTCCSFHNSCLVMQIFP